MRKKTFVVNVKTNLLVQIKIVVIIFRRLKLPYSYSLISRFQRDISRGFIFEISTGKHEKRALYFSIQAFST